MKTLLAAVCLLGSGAVWAQEIGSELPPDQQNQFNPPPSYDNPYAQPPPPPEPAARVAQPAAPEQAVPGPRKGAFGLRANFTGSTASAVGAAPTIGMKFLASDTLAITLDVGLGLSVASRFGWGFGTGFGIQAYLGGPDKPIRPFFLGEATFGKVVETAGKGWTLGFNVGGGGEYFFSDYFSVQGSALVGLPLNLDDLDTFPVTTFQPGIGANFYF